MGVLEAGIARFELEPASLDPELTKPTKRERDWAGSDEQAGWMTRNERLLSQLDRPAKQASEQAGKLAR